MFITNLNQLDFTYDPETSKLEFEKFKYFSEKDKELYKLILKMLIRRSGRK